MIKYLPKRNEDGCLHRDSYRNVHSSPNWNKLKWLSAGEWIIKFWYNHTTEYYAITRNKWTHTTT